MGKIVDRLASEFPKAVVAGRSTPSRACASLYAMRSGITISIDDVKTPSSKTAILDRHEAEAEKVEKQFHRGIITDGERRSRRKSKSGPRPPPR
jgi:DNA-directed RNA polymerase subunit beta'